MSHKLVLASHNPGKVREIADLLAPHALEVVPAAELNLPEPEETGATFAENAILKGIAAASATGLPALADDSGIAVTALSGQPGIYSARWAQADVGPGVGPDKDFAVAMQRVERELDGAADRTAAFICVLCLAWPNGRNETFEGRVAGDLVWPPRGDKGFGYDPMFVPESCDQTFAEMDPAAKHALSHRTRAFAKLLARGFADL